MGHHRPRRCRGRARALRTTAAPPRPLTPHSEGAPSCPHHPLGDAARPLGRTITPPLPPRATAAPIACSRPPAAPRRPVDARSPPHPTATALTRPRPAAPQHHRSTTPRHTPPRHTTPRFPAPLIVWRRTGWTRDTPPTHHPPHPAAPRSDGDTPIPTHPRKEEHTMRSLNGLVGRAIRRVRAGRPANQARVTTGASAYDGA